MKKIILAALLLTIWGCGKSTPDTNQSESTPSPAAQEVVSTDKDTADFAPLDLDQLDSPFTQKTVLKLNSIVQKSLDIIEQFDKEIPEIREDIDAYKTENKEAGARIEADKALARLADMHDRSKNVFTEMKSAEAQVIASGEVYNDAILAAMVGFVEDVKLELADEIKLLAKKLTDD